ncbi:hypothetical protein [Micromonospora globbae]|uniref:hypothetical protein n=1 Tax=Micromonospora globbae TaxID=1894969 RepID=UPI0034471CEF
MTHPHQLHALRAAWTLHATRQHLDRAVAREAAERRAEARIIAAAAAIQAWRPIPGPAARGVHGDPASRAAVNVLEPEWRDGQLARLAGRTADLLRWLARNTDPRPDQDHPEPLHHLQRVATRLGPAGAWHLARWLDEADQRIRDTLHLDPPGTPLPGLRCPRCARRQLHAHTTGPRSSWTITCTPTCTCAGDTCPCRMPIRLADVPHVWGPDHPLTTSLTSAA